MHGLAVSTRALSAMALAAALLLPVTPARASFSLSIGIHLGSGFGLVIIGGPSARELYEDCLDEIDEVVEDTLGDIDEDADRGVLTIQQLAQSNAPASVVLRAASSAKREVRSEQRSAQAELNRIAGRCMIALRRRGAPRDFNLDVLRARDGARRELSDAVAQANARIDAAAADATQP